MSTLPRRVTECDLRKLRSEHDAYHALHAEATRRERLMSVVGRAPLHLVPSDLRGCRGLSCEQYRKPCREGCATTFKEMACTSGDAPTVPTRRLPTKPRLSAWRRLLLWLTRWSASIRRT